MLWIEKKWLSHISPTLKRFRWTTEDTAKCRCPICGDSKKSEVKARGNFYPLEQKLLYRCFNCGASMTLGSFIKSLYPATYSEYLKDYLTESPHRGPLAFVDGISNAGSIESKEPHENASIAEIDGIKVSELHNRHPALLYLKSRMIPESLFDKIFFAPDFEKWVRKNTPKDADKRYDKLSNDARIIFPILDFDGSVIGFQGRSINSNTNLRYITVKFYEKCSRIFGRETLNIETRVLVVEGPIDSLFLPNCLALCGGDVSRDLAFLNKDKTVIVLDNEPRNKDTVKRIKKAIDSGFKVVIWNDISSNLKDINAMILSGMVEGDILSVIDKNTFSGARAKLELARWKKI